MRGVEDDVEGAVEVRKMSTRSTAGGAISILVVRVVRVMVVAESDD